MKARKDRFRWGDGNGKGCFNETGPMKARKAGGGAGGAGGPGMLQ